GYAKGGERRGHWKGCGVRDMGRRGAEPRMVHRRQVLKVLLAVGAWLLWPVPARAASLPPATEAALRNSDLIYVATRRRNGALSSIKPVWFYYDDGKIFFTTSPEGWKAKRIAAGSPLY